MKVVLITNNINQIGGIERVICNLSNALSNNAQYKIEIISIFSEKLYSIFNFNSQIKIRHLGLTYLESSGIKSRVKNNNIMKQNLYNQLKDLDCHTVITFHPFVSEWMAYIRKKSKVAYKLIMTDHSHYKCFGLARRLVTLNTYRKSDMLVVLTNDYAKYYKKYVKQVVVIPNAIESIQATNIDYDSKNIICVGRIEEVKGFDMLLESFSKISDKFEDWKLIIVGDGSSREKLKKQVLDLNINSQVSFTGFKDDVISEMKQASVFVLPSRFEGFPLVLLEAMSCGLACISYDAPWSRDMIVDNETGLMAKYLEINDLTDKLEQLISNSEYRQRIGLNGKKEVEKFLLDNIVVKWEVLLSII